MMNCDQKVVEVAYCPEHGLHGERDTCFVCGEPVQQVPMTEAAPLLDLLEACLPYIGEGEAASVRSALRAHGRLDGTALIPCPTCGGKGWNAIPYIEEDPRRAAACCRCNGTGKVRP